MKHDTPSDDATDPTDRLEDPAALCERTDVRVTRETTAAAAARDHRGVAPPDGGPADDVEVFLER